MNQEIKAALIIGLTVLSMTGSAQGAGPAGPNENSMSIGPAGGGCPPGATCMTAKPKTSASTEGGNTTSPAASAKTQDSNGGMGSAGPNENSMSIGPAGGGCPPGATCMTVKPRLIS